ncbi:N-acetyltransferase [Metasolibacillus meyeri]|uniref:N-acetyltransferase n=1 Tax=Metasolibacillus meyeri TaxID=1071052 RepID=A0AAW9NQE8_9BACL|nr:N-acetyltransferase [Metasolibacillus meyeri]MEC1177974.1 N-acetyltransferase [Metasolibacillus meyeri]
MIELWTNTNKVDVLMDIWLNTNIEAHEFIPAEYWHGNYELVKRMLPEADLYTFSQDGKIIGFAGIVEASYIAGIFVLKEWQAQGVGKALLDVCKAKYDKLTLDVYDKNTRAIAFYKNNGFTVVSESIDNNTGEVEYHMEWK